MEYQRDPADLWEFSNELLADDQLGYVPNEENIDEPRCVYCGKPVNPKYITAERNGSNWFCDMFCCIDHETLMED
jgi:hypothetical protein